METLKFYYNGIKTANGVLNKGSWRNHEPGEVRFYADSYNALPPQIVQAFNIRNETDSQSDYFDKDKFTVNEGEPYFIECLEAYIKSQTKFLKRMIDKYSQEEWMEESKRLTEAWLYLGNLKINRQIKR